MSRRTPQPFIVLAGLSLALALFWPNMPPVAASAALRWGSPVQVGANLSSSWFPNLAADPTGAVRLLWEGTRKTGPGACDAISSVFLSQLSPTGWTPPADIQTTDGSYAGRTMIASDGRWVHVLYRKEIFENGQTVRLWYIRAPAGADLANAHSWSAPRPMSDDMAYYSQFAMLPNGDILCVFNQILPAEDDGGARRTALFVRRSTDDGATWSVASRISDTPGQVARSGVVLSRDQKTLIAFWDEGYENMSGLGQPDRIGVARSIDGGLTWIDRRELASPNGPIEQSFVAFTPDGPVLVYRATDMSPLFYRTSPNAGASWSDEREIPDTIERPYTNKHHFDRFSLAADSDGRVLLAYIGSDQSAPRGLAVVTTTFASGTWSPPVSVAKPDGYPEYPQLAVALGNQVHLAYFVRDNEYDVGHYTLWAIAGQSDARPLPAASPVPAMIARVAPAPTTIPDHQIQSYPVAAAPPPLRPIPGERLDTPLHEVSSPAFQALESTTLALAALFSLAILCTLIRHWRV